MNIETTNAPNSTETAIGFIPCYRLPFLSLYQIDVIEGLKNIPDKSQDLIIADPPYYKAINECYPLLIEQINNLNKQNKLALVLQKLESFICIDQIGKLPSPKITIHDSVLVQIEDYNYFKKMIENEFQKLDLKVSFKPDLKNKNTLNFNQQ